MALAAQTIDKEDVARFSRIAGEWWDENGTFRPLHQMNPLRLKYIRDRAASHFGKNVDGMRALSGLSALDIGCGGGLLCEPLARLGAKVTGIDASEENIEVASLHAQKMGLEIEYRCASPEELVASGQWPVAGKNKNTGHRSQATGHFDLVLALEIVEHVADVPAFLSACAALVKPGGMLFMSTLNRTLKSFAFAIVGAEYVLHMLPRGTHQWNKFLCPAELCGGLRKEGLRVEHMTGMVFDPLKREWKLSDGDVAVNYIVTAVKSK